MRTCRDASGQQLPHFMRWAIGTGWMNWGWCPKDDAAILYAENDYNDIKTYIDNIKLHDGTATHIGMKYGVALLNPSSRDEFDELADRGIIEDEYRTRPANFDDDVVKYIVLMTDGRTTDQSRPRVPNDGRTDGGNTITRRDWNYTHIYGQMQSGGGVAATTAFPNVLLTGDGITGGIPTGMTVNDNLGDILDRFGGVNRNLDLRMGTTGAAQVEYGYPAATNYVENGFTHNIARNEANITRACATRPSCRSSTPRAARSRPTGSRSSRSRSSRPPTAQDPDAGLREFAGATTSRSRTSTSPRPSRPSPRPSTS